MSNEMRTFRFAAMAVLLVSAAACAPPPPTYADATQGLYTQPAASVPIDAPVNVRQPVVVVFSNNFETYLEYTQAGIEVVKSQILVNAQAGRDIDPNRLADRLVATVKSRFPDVVMANDLAEAKTIGANTILLLDILPYMGRMSGDTTKLELSAIFFDDTPAPVSRLRGYGEAVVPYPAWDIQFQKVSDQALAELQVKLTTLVKDER